MRTPVAISLLFLATYSLAQTSNPAVVISQIYGGGGNSGATFRNDFIELFNRTGQPVSLTGWSVQYAASTGTTWQRTLLSGTIQPGHYYLVQEAQGNGGTVSLPTPDLMDTINLSQSDGKVALVNSTTALTGAAPSGVQIIDFVGYGTANAAEGIPVPPLTNTTAAIRLSGGCTASNNNSADFTVGSPNPRNSSGAPNPCSISSPAFTITKTHTGNFSQGQAGAAYTIGVSNSGTAPTIGTVTLADALPAGLTLVAMSGAGWTCQSASCTRNDPLAAGAAYPAVTVLVNVSGSAQAGITNQANVSGGGAAPQSASDPTTIAAASACGTERWSVKTGTDSDGGSVNLSNATSTTIANLIALPAPASLPENNRISPTETTVFTLNAILSEYKLEDDSDYHLVLADTSGNTMIAEIPKPSCVAAGSPFAPGITNARSELDARFTASTSFTAANVPVVVKGVGFFDVMHGQTGVAPNGIELHPVLDVAFTPVLPPSPASVTPTVSTGASQTITINYNAPNGVQTLDVVNVLINTALDGRQACYLAYSRPSNALYIVADNGDATQLSGKVMDGTGSVGNSQCNVSLANSSATSAGNTLTLVLSLTFSASFGGNKAIYAAARDLTQNNSGWQTMGAIGVQPLPNTFPNPVGLTPSSGTRAAQTISFTYQDQSSGSNLQTVWALINTAVDGRAACYVAYYQPGNQLYLYPDNGDGSQATNIALTGNNSIGNSQCFITAQGSSIQVSGNRLNVTLPITFKTTFAGFKGIWLAAQTTGGIQTSPWQILGAWSVPEQ